jgi:hypothetical protein
LTEEDKHALRLLVASRGWAIVQQMAHERIEAAKVVALENTDEAQFLDLYRRAHATRRALLEFTEDISGLAE